MTTVLFISRKWPPALGGMENYSFHLVQALHLQCDVTTNVLPGRETGAPPSALALAGFFVSKMLTLAFSRRYDAIHIGDLVLWPLAFVAFVFRRSPSVTITAYGLDIVYGRQKGLMPTIYGAYLKLGVALTKRWVKIIAISESTAQLCKDTGFLDIHIIPLGVAPQIRSDNEEPEQVDHQPFVLFVGRFVERKGAGWFIREVLPQLPTDIKLIVVGRKWDKSEWEAISGSDRVIHEGMVSQARLAALRRAAIAVLMPNIPTGGTDIEGFGLTAVEAGADGGVLLASGIEGIKDAVIDGETGFLLPAMQPETWQEKIKTVRSWSSEKRHTFIKKAQHIIAEVYSWERVAKETIDVYRS